MGRLRACWMMGLLLVAAGSLQAQTVTLQIKPHPGDTLRMRLDQQSEMTGVRRTKLGESSAMVMTSMKMFSRAIVEGFAERRTTLLAVTDSVILTTSDDRARDAAAIAQERMRGQRVRFRVAPDGEVGMNDVDDGAPRDVAEVVSLMPAAFPKGSIRVGESWTRDMPLPTGVQFGAQLSGKLHVTFRLDSVTHHGGWAFVSMHGDMQPASGPGAASEMVLEKGTVDGTMLVDKKRGWLTESWFNIFVSSVTTPQPSIGVSSMRVQVRVTQHMQTLARR